jgi:hypothetical protein
MHIAPRFVANYDLLVSIFGDWPSFHDAEVLSLTLDRAGPRIDLTLYVFRTGPELNDQGQFKRCDEVVVEMRFIGVGDLRLRDFNEQNVLAELSLLEESGGKRVHLHGLYGLTGTFLCEQVEIRKVDRLVSAPN